MKKTLVSLTLLLVGCQVDYHPYDTRIEAACALSA